MKLLPIKTAVLRCRRSLTTHTLQIASNRCIAYRQIPGQREPTVVMIPGLHSYTHMSGMKAQCVMRYCDMNDYAGLLYDHECMGESKYSNRGSVLFHHWIEDAVKAITELTEGRIVLVGTSMGGWIAIVAAQQLVERVHGLVLFAPALNYVYPYYTKHMQVLPDDVRQSIESGSSHVVAAGRYGDALLKKDFAEDSLRYQFSLEPNSIPLHCPIRIIHGLKDDQVDPEQSRRLLDALQSNDVDLIYRKESGHQLETPPDLELFLNTLDRLVKDNPVKTLK